MEAFALLCGILAAYGYGYCGAIFSSLLCILFSWRCYCFFFVIGCCYALVHQYALIPKGLPTQDILRHAHIQGTIASFVEKKGDALQFMINIVCYEGKPAQAHALLRCYKGCPDLQRGQKITVTATLKKPRNFGNPGSFDYIGYLRARHADWVGYLHAETLVIQSLPSKKNVIDTFRNHASIAMDQLNLNPKSNAVFTALSLGISDKLTHEDWSLFQRTGTTHLMVISGAHISLVAGLIFSLVSILAKYLPRFCLWFPAQRCGAIFAVIAAIVYALLAGCAVPAQRAVLGCCLYFSRFIISRDFNRWQSWRYAMMAVLLAEPHAALMKGFYLSFIAVAILLLASQRFHFPGIKKIVTLQLCCLIGLLPISLYCFAYGAVNGFFANLIAIPYVGIVIVPISLLVVVGNLYGVALPSSLLNASIELLYGYLQMVDRFSFMNLTTQFHHLYFPVTVLFLLFSWLFFPKKHLWLPMGMLMLGLSFPSIEFLSKGEAHMDVIDVGQGLSVLITTKHHALLYDTGVKLYQGPDMGRIAILPYLHFLGIQALDIMVISHPDLDHRGGMESIEQNIKVNELIVDDPEFYHRGANCHTYPAWQWDDVHFEFLAMNVPLKPRNNHSCVLRIYNSKSQWLLTGDIERSSEEWLLEHYPEKLRSSVLLVPHHGSKTSSSMKFIKTVQPNIAIISAGFDNRFRFPHQQTLRHYARIGSCVKTTVQGGLIRESLIPSTKCSPA